ncbi:iron uptake transporter permease EfeU [Actinoplanes sp. N902-109]|uniref:iron uptake transporter permease EfeU n=1 Tax=Actinoplanes sp. (strain N902-109) TaxID=649831 RepID=UPI0003294FF4|nr:iron uptake transporter permease EfeU [Actinoplanes sp. N902-109]AGL16988.1 iron permease FTR1 [Actinoplanes sp. N902-109]
MIPTLVIGLREGVEASLIVGIIAAFLNHAGRRDALRQVWLGVGGAVVLCLAVGVSLFVLSRELPQHAQEGLETVVGLLALAMVTFMILWMTRHARSMRRELEGATQDALATGSARALVLMAFLAVLREGFETAVFLIAVIENSASTASATVGALIGIAIAVVLGWGLYRGGVHLNLARFFKVTGLVLAVVAAGLAMTAAHTAFEAGWLTAGRDTAVDLTWLVRPGTVLSSLLTGVLGIQPRPTVAESVAWLLYAIPVLSYVAWPRRRRPAVQAPPARVAA